MNLVFSKPSKIFFMVTCRKNIFTLDSIQILLCILHAGSEKFNSQQRVIFQILPLHLYYKLHLVGKYHCKPQHSYANFLSWSCQVNYAHRLEYMCM